MNEQAIVAFQALKEAMVSTPVLALPRFDEPSTVETDASDVGLGAILMQHGHPIAFISKAMSEKNKNLSIYEKEFLALILAVEKWRPYLQRSEFVIKTDHKSLIFLENQRLQSDLQKKAMTKLMGLQFKIVYKKCKENIVADALSRVGQLMSIIAVTEVKLLWIQQIINSYAIDEQAQQLLAQQAINSPNEQRFSRYQGIIRKGNQIWIGENSALCTKLIASMHDSALG